MLKDTLQKLNNIARLPGKNDKRALLKSYLNNSVFSKVISLMLSEEKTFHIKSLPLSNMPPTAGDSDQIFDFLEKLAGQRGASDKDKKTLSAMVGNGDTREVVERILTGKTKAGFSATSVNKAIPGSIFITPYQRCSGIKNAPRVTYPAICQRKADGIFSYASLGFNRALLSRRGKSYDLLGALEDLLLIYSERLKVKYPVPVLCGELTVLEPDGSVMPRKKGNGITNKFIKGTGTPDLASRVKLTVWDVLSMKDFRLGASDKPYGERWDDLRKAFNQEPTDKEAAALMESMVLGKSKGIDIIESQEVNNLNEAETFYKEMRDAGEEGAILKDYSTLWKSNTAATFVKMKNFVEAEFRVTAANEGKDKYVGMLGALTVESEDGLIVSNVGSGFTDAERDLEFWKGHVGDIITVKFESVISDKKRKGTKSLFIPTYVEPRFEEKNVADTAEYMENL